jgi:hypothetical protein
MKVIPDECVTLAAVKAHHEHLSSKDDMPELVDDYGLAWYLCAYSGELTPDARMVGPILHGAGLQSRRMVSKSAKSEAAYKQATRDFHEFERSCNTCQHLCRVRHDKDPHGTLKGTCAKQGSGEVMTFHPHDPMFMPCHEMRQ